MSGHLRHLPYNCWPVQSDLLLPFFCLLAPCKNTSIPFPSTLWCQIRTARSLLGPVVEYPPCLFLWTMFFSFCTLWFLFRPCFSLQSPCGFYSDRVFSNCYIMSATVTSDLRLVIPLWFLSGPRFSGSVPWGFYKEWGFYFPPPVVFIQAVVLQNLPMMFLFCPCAQSGTIEYLPKNLNLGSLSIKH